MFVMCMSTIQRALEWFLKCVACMYIPIFEGFTSYFKKIHKIHDQVNKIHMSISNVVSCQSNYISTYGNCALQLHQTFD